MGCASSSDGAEGGILENQIQQKPMAPPVTEDSVKPLPVMLPVDLKSPPKSKALTLTDLFDKINKKMTKSEVEVWYKAIGLYFNSNVLGVSQDAIDPLQMNMILSSFEESIITKAISHSSESIESEVVKLRVMHLSKSKKTSDHYLATLPFNVLKLGWLMKFDSRRKTLTKRYFVLSEGVLKYYENDQRQSKFLKGEAKLHEQAYIEEIKEEPLRFTLNFDSNHVNGLQIEASSLEEKLEWIQAINDQIQIQKLFISLGLTNPFSIPLHFKIADKVFRLHLAATKKLIGKKISHQNDTISKAEKELLSDKELNNFASPSRLKRENGELFSSPSMYSTFSSDTTQSSPFTEYEQYTILELIDTINIELKEHNKPALMVADLGLWLTAVQLFHGNDEALFDSSGDWRNRVISNKDKDIIHDALEVTFSKDEIDRFDMSPFLESSKLYEQLIVMLRYSTVTQGWVQQEGHVVKSWKSRYAVLSEGCLRYFEGPNSIPPYGVGLKGEIALGPDTRINSAGNLLKENSFIVHDGSSCSAIQLDLEPVDPNQRQNRRFTTSCRYLVLDVPTAAEKNNWIRSLNEQILVAGLFEKYCVDSSNLLKFMSLSEMLLRLHVSKNKE